MSAALRRFRPYYDLLRQNLPADSAAALPGEMMTYSIVKATLDENPDLAAKILDGTVTRVDFYIAAGGADSHPRLRQLLDPLDDDRYTYFVACVKEVARIILKV